MTQTGDPDNGAAAAGSNPGNRAPAAVALADEISAEITRRLDARLAALGLTAGTRADGTPRLPADDIEPAGPPPLRPAGRARLPLPYLWLGILIGVTVTGTAAVISAIVISTDVNNQLGGSEPYVFFDASSKIVVCLAAAWTLLLMIYIAQAVRRRGHGRGR